MLGIGALAILMTVLLNFYTVLSRAGIPLEDAQYAISATTLATTFLETAHGLAFDEVTYGQHVTHPSMLTHWQHLGPDAQPDSLPQETHHHYFNDFDDFNGYVVDTDLGDLGVYRAAFEVYYVDPNDVTQKVFNRTFTKRMDVAIWRTDLPVGASIDTVRMFTVMGYFNFD